MFDYFVFSLSASVATLSWEEGKGERKEERKRERREGKREKKSHKKQEERRINRPTWTPTTGATPTTSTRSTGPRATTAGTSRATAPANADPPQPGAATLPGMILARGGPNAPILAAGGTVAAASDTPGSAAR